MIHTRVEILPDQKQMHYDLFYLNTENPFVRKATCDLQSFTPAYIDRSELKVSLSEVPLTQIQKQLVEKAEMFGDFDEVYAVHPIPKEKPLLVIRTEGRLFYAYYRRATGEFEIQEEVHEVKIPNYFVKVAKDGIPSRKEVCEWTNNNLKLSEPLTYESKTLDEIMEMITLFHMQEIDLLAEKYPFLISASRLNQLYSAPFNRFTGVDIDTHILEVGYPIVISNLKKLAANATLLRRALEVAIHYSVNESKPDNFISNFMTYSRFLLVGRLEGSGFYSYGENNSWPFKGNFREAIKMWTGLSDDEVLTIDPKWSHTEDEKRKKEWIESVRKRLTKQ
jgi:hypothetical protein